MTSESVCAEAGETPRNRSENRLVSFNGFGRLPRLSAEKPTFHGKNNNGWAWRAQNLLILLCSIFVAMSSHEILKFVHVLASRAIERYSPCEFNCIWPTMSICDRENLNTKWLPICQKSLPLQFVFLCLGPAFFSLSSPRLRLFEYFDWLTTGMSCLGQDPVGQNCSRVKVKRRYFPHRDFEIQ